MDFQIPITGMQNIYIQYVRKQIDDPSFRPNKMEQEEIDINKRMLRERQ